MKAFEFLKATEDLDPNLHCVDQWENDQSYSTDFDIRTNKPLLLGDLRSRISKQDPNKSLEAFDSDDYVYWDLVGVFIKDGKLVLDFDHPGRVL